MPAAAGVGACAGFAGQCGRARGCAHLRVRARAWRSTLHSRVVRARRGRGRFVALVKGVWAACMHACMGVREGSGAFV